MSSHAEAIRARGSGPIITFSSVTDLYASEQFTTFLWLSIRGCAKSRVGVTQLQPLPSGLTSLDLHQTELVELPRLPASLTNLHAAACRIQHFPEVEHCLQLETIDLSDNYIEDVYKVVPHSCRTLNISFNKLTSVKFDLLPTELVNVDVSFNFLTQIPIHWISKTNSHNNSIISNSASMLNAPPVFQRQTQPIVNVVGYEPGLQHIIADTFRDEPIRLPDRLPFQTVLRGPKQKLTYDDGQNVHLSSVQKSANTSIEALLKSAPRPNFVREIKRTYGPRWMFWRWRPPIDGWVADKTVHSIHGTTYGELLEHVWSHICEHESKADLIKIMQDELLASWMMCYTGRFTRTINILTGFIDGVVVKISDREELQNCMTVLMNSLTADNLEKTMKEAKSQLNKYDISDTEKESWLTALKATV